MAEPVRSPGTGPESGAQRSADRLAVALEEVEFDVGRAFPMLRSDVGRDGTPVIELGRVSEWVADALAAVLMRAAEAGITIPGEGDEPDATGPGAA